MWGNVNLWSRGRSHILNREHTGSQEHRRCHRHARQFPQEATALLRGRTGLSGERSYGELWGETGQLRIARGGGLRPAKQLRPEGCAPSCEVGHG
eukprot:1187647-Prorocentrum_minimum.AAC.4